MARRKIKTPEEIALEEQNPVVEQETPESKRPTYEEWYKTVPAEKNNTENYNLQRAYELAPQEELDAFVSNPDAHLRSVYQNPETGNYEFVKAKNHPTLQMELDWYNGDTDDAKKFREEYELYDDGSDYYQYRKRTAAPVVEKAETPAPVVHDPETDDDEVIVPEKPTSKKNVGKVMEMGEDESMAVKAVNKPQPQPEPEPTEEEAEEQAEDLFAEEEPEEEPTDNSPEKTDESDGNPIEKTDTTDNGGKSAEGGKETTDETPEDPVLKSLRENNKALYDALERFHSNQEGAMEEMIKYLEGVQKARQTELQQTEKEVREQNLKNYRAQLYGGITELVARIGNVIAASAGAVPAQWKSPQQAWAQKAQQDAVRGDALIRQGRKDIETLNTQLETARNKYTTQVAANALEREKVRIEGNNSLLRYSQSQERNKTNEVAKIALKPAKDLMDSAGKKLNTAKNNLTTLQSKKPADRNSKAIKDAQKAYDDALKEYNDAVAAYKQKYAEVTAAASGSIFGETQK